jgi:hypothetical protein
MGSSGVSLPAGYVLLQRKGLISMGMCQAPKLVINRLGPIVDVDKAEAKEVRVKRKYTRRIAPEDDLRRVKKGKRPAILKRRMMAMGRVVPAEHVEVVPGKREFG